MTVDDDDSDLAGWIRHVSTLSLVPTARAGPRVGLDRVTTAGRTEAVRQECPVRGDAERGGVGGKGQNSRFYTLIVYLGSVPPERTRTDPEARARRTRGPCRVVEFPSFHPKSGPRVLKSFVSVRLPFFRGLSVAFRPTSHRPSPGMGRRTPASPSLPFPPRIFSRFPAHPKFHVVSWPLVPRPSFCGRPYPVLEAMFPCWA